jgi:two-component system, OmpR family, response regulator
MTHNKILLVEDDSNMNFMLQDSLEMAGYLVDSFGDGQSALNAFAKNAYDLCVLDVMLPKKDGFTLAGDIRKLNLSVPIVFLTAKNLKEDRIYGLKLGADDYITKPFSVEELILRIESILKRVYNKPTKADGNFQTVLADTTCDFPGQAVTYNGNKITLTNKETKLLKLFCLHVNKGYFVGRSMDVFISRLRKILSPDPRISIVNVHGVGYKLEVNRQQNDSQDL